MCCKCKCNCSVNVMNVLLCNATQHDQCMYIGNGCVMNESVYLYGSRRAHILMHIGTTSFNASWGDLMQCYARMHVHIHCTLFLHA